MIYSNYEAFKAESLNVTPVKLLTLAHNTNVLIREIKMTSVMSCLSSLPLQEREHSTMKNHSRQGECYVQWQQLVHKIITREVLT